MYDMRCTLGGDVDVGGACSLRLPQALFFFLLSGFDDTPVEIIYQNQNHSAYYLCPRVL